MLSSPRTPGRGALLINLESAVEDVQALVHGLASSLASSLAPPPDLRKTLSRLFCADPGPFARKGRDERASDRPVRASPPLRLRCR